MVGLFMLSTKYVDNFVDKPHLTSRKASIYAAFNKMPISQAKIKHRKINDLAQGLRRSTEGY
jgi:hypothetical protein